MNDESMQIEATAGPYRGQRLTVSASEGRQAIADGWARDPFAPVEEPKEGDKPKEEPTEEERLAIAEKAEKAARRLRGEEERDGEQADKEMAAQEPKDYQTRDVKAQAPKARR